MADKKKSDRQPKVVVVTPAGIAAYAYFNKPDTEGQFADNKYKVQLVLDADTDLSALEAKIKAFAKEVKPDVDLDDLKLPWGEGREDKEEFAGKIVLKASTKHKPKQVDTKRKPLPKSVFARSGDEVRLVCTLYFYEKVEKVKEGKKVIDVKIAGVSLQLALVQLVAKNTGGGVSADVLDDIDGFDAETDWDGGDGDDEASDDDNGDSSGDF